MISDATIQEIAALEKSRCDEYMADRACEEKTATLAAYLAEKTGQFLQPAQARALAEHLIADAHVVGYAVATYPGSGLPPTIEDIHPTREGAETEADALREAADFYPDIRVYELREVEGE